MRCPWLAQAFVYGELTQRWLVAIISPDPDRVAAWGTANGVAGGFAELCADERLVKTITEEIQQVGRTNGLNGFEIPKVCRA
jgi:long-subunit acyl-CoA synthetase (AMP-forming)